MINSREEYDKLIGINTQDIGSAKTLRKFVDEKLVEAGYEKLKGWKSMRTLLAIKAKVLSKLQKRLDNSPK